MRRRDFITLLGGSAVAWPLAARAQQPERMRRMFMSLAADDKQGQARLGVPAGSAGIGLGRWPQRADRCSLGCRRCRPQSQTRGGTSCAGTRRHPGLGRQFVGTLLQATTTVPIVFTQTPDPVGAGFVESLARPGDNATGFSIFDYSLGGKWLELLKQIAPSVTRVAVIRDPATPQGIGQFSALHSLAPSLGLEVTPVNARDAGDIKRAMAAVHRNQNSGLIVTGSNLAIIHRDLIVTLAARYRLPALYPLGFFVTSGGLISYGPDSIDPHRRAAGYVDRILKGEKPADLPVQAPTKYELVINLKTAKALGLTVPSTLLATADEVIE
jgi:putative tryptophan/tyrosine transport system substrate-binding protein